MGKKVKFANGRLFRGEGKPWSTRGYTDPDGIPVHFNEIPLYTDDGKPDMYTNKKGEKVQRTYDQPIKFQRNRTIVFDSVKHKDVIKALRDWDRCVTSKKSEGLRSDNYGWIHEIEPEVEEQKQLKAVELRAKVNSITYHLYEEASDRDFDIACAHFNVLKGSRSNKYLRLVSRSESDMEGFLAAFEDRELKQEYYYPAIVRLAIANNVIENRSGVYYLGDLELGVDAQKIHTKHSQHLGRIKAELDKVVNYADKLEKKNEQRKKESNFDDIPEEPVQDEEE